MLDVLVFDTECYGNLWLLKAIDIKTRTVYRAVASSVYGKDYLSQEDINLILSLMSKHTFVGFNSISYDKPMIEYAIAGASTYELKGLSNRLIMQRGEPGKLEYWNLPRERELNFDHVDLIGHVKPNISLKKAGARMHLQKLQELPYAHDSILTLDQVQQVDLYCDNDLWVTENLFYECKEAIEMREQYGGQFNIDLRSKSDAQMAEAVFKKLYRDKNGRNPTKLGEDANFAFYYSSPDWMQFYTPELQAFKDEMNSLVFKVQHGEFITPEALLPRKVKINNKTEEVGRQIVIKGKTYTIGMGGIHSTESAQYIKAAPGKTIIDIDVTGNYPQAIINSKAWPPAIGEDVFRPFYIEVKANRDKYKPLLETMSPSDPNYNKLKSEVAGGKGIGNGTFGKTKQLTSVLFAPQMYVTTTLGNQLTLLMLIERFGLADIEVISANTDGITVYIDEWQLNHMRLIVKEWEVLAGYGVEEVEYKTVAYVHVNSYVAVKKKGGVKGKGMFATPGLQTIDPYSEICSIAAKNVIEKGIPIEETIRSCTDVRKFVMVESVKGGAWKVHGEEPEKSPLMGEIYARIGQPAIRSKKEDLMPAYNASFAPAQREFVGKTLRYYYSNNCPGVMKSSRGTAVGHSEGAKPLMLLPENNQIPDDLDYNKYIRRAYEWLRDTGYPI